MNKIALFLFLVLIPSCALAQESPEIGQATMALSRPVVIASNQSAVPASQSGTWTTGRTWSLLFSSDSVNAVQSGSWTNTCNAGTNLNTSALALETTQTTQNTRIGDLTETAPASDTASSGLNGRLQRIAQRLTTINTTLGTPMQSSGGSVTANAGTNLNTSLLALDTSVNGILRSQGSTTSGQTGPLIQGAVTTSAPSYTTAQTSPLSLTTAGALRVDGSAVTQPISAASLPLPSGAATSANQSTIITDIGGVTESAPASDTASSGLNGRLQRIAQRLTSLIAQIPAVLGQTTMSGSLSTTIASDQTPIPVSVSSVTGGVIGSLSKNIKIEPQLTPINVTNTVTYTTLYLYNSGGGLFLGFNLEFGAGRAVVKLEIDGITVMDGTDVATLNALYAATNNTARIGAGTGIVTQASNIDVSFKWPIKFASSVKISARLSSGATVAFNQGMVYIQKD